MNYPHMRPSHTRGGSSELQHGMLLEGKWIEVAHISYDILQDRASMFKPKFVWMNCICINRTEDDEKSAQMVMMVCLPEFFDGLSDPDPFLYITISIKERHESSSG